MQNNQDSDLTNSGPTNSGPTNKVNAWIAVGLAMSAMQKRRNSAEEDQ